MREWSASDDAQEGGNPDLQKETRLDRVNDYVGDATTRARIYLHPEWNAWTGIRI